MYTAREIEAIGGRPWVRSGKHRIYINHDVWGPWVGLHVNFYKTGNVSGATLRGERISNGRATEMINSKVFWEGGEIHIYAGTGLADDIREAIDAEVAAIPPENQCPVPEVHGMHRWTDDAGSDEGKFMCYGVSPGEDGL